MKISTAIKVREELAKIEKLIQEKECKIDRLTRIISDSADFVDKFNGVESKEITIEIKREGSNTVTENIFFSSEALTSKLFSEMFAEMVNTFVSKVSEAVSDEKMELRDLNKKEINIK